MLMQLIYQMIIATSQNTREISQKVSAKKCHVCKIKLKVNKQELYTELH